MPTQSIVLIRTAFIYFFAGLTLGALLLANKGAAFSDTLWRWQPIHVELLLAGWLLQLVLGVANWMFPRIAGGQPRRHLTMQWAAFGLLNAGILWRIACLLDSQLAGAGHIGRALEFAGVALFAFALLPRVKPFGT